MPSAYTQPPGSRGAQTAVLDSQDRSLPSAALAAQVSEGGL